MIETLVLAFGLPLIATTITRAPDVIHELRWRSPPMTIERPKDDACASVRLYGYAGNVDVARIGDPCGILRPANPPKGTIAAAQRPQ